jgi:hypothetical protein
MERRRPAWWKRVVRTGALTLGLALLLGALFVMIIENSLIYFPDKDAPGPSPGEDVFLTTSDGLKIHAWYVPQPGAAVTILYFHGNAGSLGDRREFIGKLQRAPANVLAVDYRGYGRSEGSPDEAGLYRDAQAAWDWLAARTPPERIVILGKSLGGGPACELASRVDCGGLVLQSTFTSARDMAPLVMPLFPASWFMRTRYDNLAKVAKIGCPKLFIHSRSDEIIPFAMAERLFGAAAEPKEAAWFDAGGHNTLWLRNAQEYGAALERFVRNPSSR